MATIFQSSQRSPAASSAEHVPTARANSVLELIGNTPLLEITRVTEGLLRPGVRLFAKLEGFNPGGSVKDRAVRHMVEFGLKRGELRPGKTIIDSTSGNTGIALAMVGAALGYPVEIVMASNVSRERKKIIEAFGAKPIYSDPLEGSDGAMVMARRIIAANPDRYFKPDQYNNPANWQAHYEGTGREIWEQTGGRLTHFVAVLGTSGTFMGTARRLKEQNPQIRVYAVQPAHPLHGLEGMKYMPTALVPGIYDPALADEHLTVETEEAQAVTRDLAHIEGLFAGPSGGAAVLACLKVARTLDHGTIVTVLPDGGSRYLSDSFWDEGTA